MYVYNEPTLLVTQGGRYVESPEMWCHIGRTERLPVYQAESVHTVGFDWAT